jgi:hypothetical protein
VPWIASPLEHVVASTAFPSTPLDRFTLNHFALNRFAQSTPPPPAPEYTINLNYFTNAPDRMLC